MKLTGAQSLIRSLVACDVDVVFGLPGGAILPAYDPLRESSVRHIRTALPSASRSLNRMACASPRRSDHA